MLRPLQKHGRPHWETAWPEELWPVFQDFGVFLGVLWDHLGLPLPTPAQLEIAHRLQYGYDSTEARALDDHVLTALRDSPREDIVRCFRSAGKSYITSGFAAWRLMRNHRDEKILVVSASGSKAKEFVAQLKGILASLDLCQWLLKGDRVQGATRRDQSDQFDVAGASLSQSYSVAARGITGQITGSRATLLVADDMETIGNSKTEDARMGIIRTVQSDFIPITKTEHGRGDIIILGTPQTEESVYNVLVKTMGFRCMTIPVEWPKPDKIKNYVLTTDDGEEINILASYLWHAAERGEIRPGQPTDTRFTVEELAKVRSKGAATFALQYMLDTSLSDAERYPLKQSDLIVFSTHPEKCPLVVQWGKDSEKRNLVNDIPNLGFSGDHFLRPLFVDTDWVEYNAKILFVDPAGRGQDEVAWAILASYGGYFYLLDVCASKGDPEEAMHEVARDALKWKVSTVLVEPNFGQGMWTTAFKPILRETAKSMGVNEGCSVLESEWAKGQKEARIIDTLEPVMTTHRLVVNEALIRKDVKTGDPKYSLMYQLTHITRDRGALKHDDRIDAVAGGVAHFVRSAGESHSEHREAYRQRLMDQEIEDFMESYVGLGTQRGGRVGVVRSARRNPDGTRELVYFNHR